jgi:hypothetical protein
MLTGRLLSCSVALLAGAVAVLAQLPLPELRYSYDGLEPFYGERSRRRSAHNPTVGALWALTRRPGRRGHAARAPPWPPRRLHEQAQCRHSGCAPCVPTAARLTRRAQRCARRAGRPRRLPSWASVCVRVQRPAAITRATDRLLQQLDKVPERWRKAIRNNGACRVSATRQADGARLAGGGYGAGRGRSDVGRHIT